MKTEFTFRHRLLRSFLRHDLAEEVEGDLEEKYRHAVLRHSRVRARVNYYWQVLNYLRPFAFRKLYTSPKQFVMFSNYFKVGFRNLNRNRGYSFINIGGLATGMAVAVLIGLWVYDELTFDRNFKNYDRIAQAYKHWTLNGKSGTQNAIPYPLEAELRTKFADNFSHISMSTWTGDYILSHDDKKITKTGNFYQQDFPEMLGLTMLAGDPKALKDPGSVLLSQSTAKAFFGDADPMNQPMLISNRMNVKVAGVYADLPANSSFADLDFMASWDMFVTLEPWIKRAETQWGNNSFQLYVELAPGVTAAQASEKIRDVVWKNKPNEKDFDPAIFLHEMKDWHLRSNFKDRKQTAGAIQLVFMVGTIGLFVLLLACINFMNLSTARSEKRAKEVGIRMTIGSVRSQLINQFLSESFMVVVLAFVLAMAIVWLSLPAFNKLAGKEIVVLWLNPVFLLTSLTFIVVTSLVAGSYPALYLSSFRPVNVLKGTFRLGRFASLPRKVLVVVQFTVSIALVIGTAIIYQQVQFTKNRPVGYDRQGLIMVPMSTPEFYGRNDIFRNELRKTGAVEEFGVSSSPLTGVWSNSGGFSWPGKNPSLYTDFGIIQVSHEYGTAVGWKVLKGRDFDRTIATDSSAIIINTATAEFIGVKDLIGLEIKWDDRTYHVVAVIDDMIMSSPYRPVKATVWIISDRSSNFMNLRLTRNMNTREALDKIEPVFAKLAPSAPFEYEFADDAYAKKFNSEERIGKLTLVFAGLAILISCLGLTGLASFVAEQRTKEIGIRKVLGATVAGLWQMLSKDFVWLVLISFAIASPLAWYFVTQWLTGFEFKVPVTVTTFVVTAVGAIVVTLITVSFQAIRAALMNPVKSLRSE